MHCLETCSEAFYRGGALSVKISGLFPPQESMLWKGYHRGRGLPSHRFTSVEGHMVWWTSVSPRSSHPPSSISWHLENGTELWAKIDTFPCHTESEFLKAGKPPGFFKLFSTWVWKILFPDRKFDSHFTKSMGTWLNCIIASHKRTLSRNRVLQSCLLQYEQNRMLVFKHPGSSLSSLPWLYILKTPLWKLFRAIVPAQSLSADVRPNYTEIGLLKGKTFPWWWLSWDWDSKMSEPRTQAHRPGSHFVI